MNQVEEFLHRANECQQIARSNRDAEAKATWKRLAERWERCADIARDHEKIADLARYRRRNDGSPARI
jgi:hypothetical protein